MSSFNYAVSQSPVALSLHDHQPGSHENIDVNSKLPAQPACKAILSKAAAKDFIQNCMPEDGSKYKPVVYALTFNDFPDQALVQDFSGRGSLTEQAAADPVRSRMNASILMNKPLKWDSLGADEAGEAVSTVASQMKFYPQAAARGMESLAAVFTPAGVATPEMDGNSATLAEGVNQVLASIDPGRNVVVVADHWAAKQLAGQLPSHVSLVASGTNTSANMGHLLTNPYFKAADTIVAAGGCGALDVTKASSIGKKLFVMPTLLSSNCICCNRAVINNSFSLASTKPQRVIYLQQLLTKGVAANWVNSGLGDYFGVLSAFIDNKHGAGMYTRAADKGGKGGELSDIAKPYKEATDLLGSLSQWLDADAKALESKADVFWLDGQHGHERYNKVIEVLHGTGAEDIRLGTNRYRIGGEHDFYRVLIDDFADLRAKGPTHGEIVAVGVLLSLHTAGESELYHQSIDVFKKLGLPMTYNALAEKGLTRERMMQALTKVAQPEKQGTSVLAGLAHADIEKVLDHVLTDVQATPGDNTSHISA